MKKDKNEVRKNLVDKMRNQFDNRKNKVNKKPYDEEYKVYPLKLFVIIVNRGQGDFFIEELFEKFNVACAFLRAGNGTATREIYEILGIGETKKDVLIALVSEGLLDGIFNMINNRFAISAKSRGVAFTLKIDSMVSVLLYRFLTDSKHNVKK